MLLVGKTGFPRREHMSSRAKPAKRAESRDPPRGVGRGTATTTRRHVATRDPSARSARDDMWVEGDFMHAVALPYAKGRGTGDLLRSPRTRRKTHESIRSAYTIWVTRSTAGMLCMAPVGQAATHLRQLAQKVRASSGTIGFTTVEKPRL